MDVSDPFADALILTGPTGCGKTALALDLAERLNAEVVSMDSMAVYRGLDIGTAKPTPTERARVPHHLIDVLEPWEAGSVAWWLAQAAACCREIASRGKRVLIVGGTPMYLKALLRGLFEGPGANSALRLRLEDEARQVGTPAMHERLRHIDPATASRVHANDLRRIVRALEVFELTGQPISAWQQQWSASVSERNLAGHLEPRAVWLDLPRDKLYDRINRRVESMFAAGLVEEVRGLRGLERPLSRQAAQALGYKEVFAYIEGAAGLEATIEEVQMRSRNFAKRQMSWFRNLAEVHPLRQELTATLWAGKIQ
ncbi:MAG: tRNA (adenosine(37)-N6)-dimethylallyltransferase MiaA [Planctomycetes bacterium]|nr:tRNA (adenosine(37)-N6)-dimethylallyltransferase MiaA [Planctomycetota bacterium]